MGTKGPGLGRSQSVRVGRPLLETVVQFLHQHLSQMALTQPLQDSPGAREPPTSGHSHEVLGSWANNVFSCWAITHKMTHSSLAYSSVLSRKTEPEFCISRGRGSGLVDKLWVHCSKETLRGNVCFEQWFSLTGSSAIIQARSSDGFWTTAHQADNRVWQFTPKKEVLDKWVGKAIQRES